MSSRFLAPSRRALLRAGLSSPLLAVAGPALSQSVYPSRPVRAIVPFVPGGNADSTARIFFEALSRHFGQSFVVENRGGAGGMIGAAAVARAEPDGYTLLCTSTGPLLAAWQMAGSSATYRLADLRAVALLNATPNVLVVPERSPIRNFDELARATRSRPGELKTGHPGNGTTGHVNLLQVQRALATEFVIVGYRGAGPAVQDLLGGRLDLVATDVPSALQLVRAGQLRALAVTSAQRTPALPDVPTMAELGRPEVSATNFTSIMGPRGIPDEIAARIEAGVAAALAQPAVLRQIDDIGTVPPTMTTAEFAGYLQREAATYAALIQSGLLRNE